VAAGCPVGVVKSSVSIDVLRKRSVYWKAANRCVNAAPRDSRGRRGGDL